LNVLQSHLQTTLPESLGVDWGKKRGIGRVDLVTCRFSVAQLLATLPRLNAFVFASASKAGRISDARSSHAKALQSAGIDGLTIHGLHRSFSLLGEVAGAPAGAIAQVMGHKPSATARATGRAVLMHCARIWKRLKPTFWSRRALCLMQRPSRAKCAWSRVDLIN